ncbi:MAG: 2-oxo acid dehydrogenase subunit E2, partial [Pseudomonadota bacterium]
MAIEITMPALSPTMEEGTLAKWNVKAGDTVEAGDVIAEIETDKATMEVEAVDEGTVAQILIEAGTEGVKVNEVIAILAEEGEGVSEVSTRPREGKDPVEQTEEPDTQESQSRGNGLDEDKASELASTPVKLADLGEGDDRIKASPLARRIAALKGVDLKGLKGSGPHGRIVKKDVEAAAGTVGASETQGDAPVQAMSISVTSPEGLILPQILDDRVYDPGSYRLEPLDGMRKTVAKRLTQSFMQVPHFPLNVDIALDDLLAFRKRVNDAAPEGVKVSVNDMLIKASALALMAEPDCNASYSDKGIAYHKAAHVSVAVAVEGGLITPVIFDAEKKGLSTIAAEMKDLATRARERKLKPQEYTGGTFSISNLGMFGIKSFAS